jgi:uncharacterized YccA/Bax inhibitor family protein
VATALGSNYRRLAESFPPVDLAPERRFTAEGVLDKLSATILVVVLAGGVGAFLLPAGAAFLCALPALGFAFAGVLRPGWARVCAPAYAVFEGLALGAVSRFYADFGGGIVPLAVLFTGGVFVGCLAAFRSGLVRVTPRFFRITMVATFGLIAVCIAAMLGLPIPGPADLGTKGMLFGLFGLGVGVLNLFVDFERISTMERAGAAKQGEWYGVLLLLTSLVLVYLSILRTLASASSRR